MMMVKNCVITKSIVWVVDNHWSKADVDLEFRLRSAFYLSKVLCWTAVDKAIKVAKLLRKIIKLAC